MEQIHPFGFCFRRDPNAFLFIATGSLFGLSLMFAEFAMRLHHAAPIAVFFRFALCSVAYFAYGVFVRGLLYRFDVFAQQDELILRERLGPWVQGADERIHRRNSWESGSSPTISGLALS